MSHVNVAGAWQARRRPLGAGERPYEIAVRIDQPVRTGEFLGQKTIADLQDFMRTVIYEQNQLASAAKACTAWATNDPKRWTDWKTRFDAYAQNVANLIAYAQARVDHWAEWTRTYVPIATPLPDCALCGPAGLDIWKELVLARRTAAELDAQLRADSQCTPADYSGMPQPSAADPDLKVYNSTGEVTKAIDKTVASARELVTSRTPYLVVGVAAGVIALLWLQNGRAAAPAR